MDEHSYDRLDVKGQHRLIVANPSKGDRRYLVSDPANGIYGEAVCGKCGRHGIDLTLLPCTSGPFGTGDKL